MTAWNFKDLTGQRFGRLTVIERAENAKNGRVRWKCRCDCGNETTVASSNLKLGKIKSCGCLNLQKIIERNTTHGMKSSPVYGAWCGIKDRCFNSNHKYYSCYGGRGIKVYPAWIHDFQMFYDYVSKLEHFGEEGYTLDRIDNNGDYAPNNLRWADRKTQGRNKRNNHIVEYNGKSMTLKESAEKSGINYSTLQYRYRCGDRGDRLFRPVTSSTKS